MKIKEFNSLAIAGVTSSILLEEGKFGDIHEVIEFVLGRPVFTHEIPDVAKETKQLILAQYPEMPTGNEPGNFHDIIDFVHKRYGLSLELQGKE